MKKVLFRFLLCLVFVIVIYGKMEVKADDSIVLKVGEKKQLSGKGYFGSTDKDIATVSKKGMITAKKTGKCQVVYVDKKNNATIYNVTVKGKVKKKNTLYIGKNGWEYEVPKFYFSGISVTSDVTTLGELVLMMEQTDYDEPNIDIESKGIYDRSELFGIFKNGQTMYTVYCNPGESKYLKDMIITGILPETYNNRDEYLDDYWLRETFSIKNAPSYDNFPEEIMDKFSGYTESNVEIIEDGNRYIVSIKVDKDSTKDLGYYVRNVSFTYVYDKSDRKCIRVGYSDR